MGDLEEEIKSLHNDIKSLKYESSKGLSNGDRYQMIKLIESEINPLDEKIQLENSFTVILDFKSSMWLLGTEIDWVVDKWSSKFEFRNKNIESTCGCGESFYFKNEKSQ